jgi:hypothetical protein
MGLQSWACWLLQGEAGLLPSKPFVVLRQLAACVLLCMGRKTGHAAG